MVMREPVSINDIRTAIRELSVRAELARKEGREQDAAEIERRIQAYRDELSRRP
jgi:propanediol dehydratase small subunit